MHTINAMSVANDAKLMKDAAKDRNDRWKLGNEKNEFEVRSLHLGIA